jgi:hypothetical protein
LKQLGKEIIKSKQINDVIDYHDDEGVVEVELVHHCPLRRPDGQAEGAHVNHFCSHLKVLLL